MPDATDWPVAIAGMDGSSLRLGDAYFAGAPGSVWIRTGPKGVSLDAAGCEALAQALVAASWRAGWQEGYGQGRDEEAAGLPAEADGHG